MRDGCRDRNREEPAGATPDRPRGPRLELDERVYRRLVHLAVRWAPVCGRDPVVEPGAIAHEAYLRLTRHPARRFESTEHFLACAALTVRTVALDRCRAGRRLRRGGGWARVELSEAIPGCRPNEVARLAVHQAMRRLAEAAPRAATVVALHGVAGWSVAQTAATIGCGTATVSRDWRFARAFLARVLRRAGSS